MGYRSNSAAATGGAAKPASLNRIGDDWRSELDLAAAERTNLLLVGTCVVSVLLEMLRLDLHNEAILSWRPGEPLELPTAARAATFIIHDIDQLTASDQQGLLRWLNETAGRVRVISTSHTPLWPRVKSGAFDDGLYYRLNIVYVDVSAPQLPPQLAGE
jgi:Sigma-54 interaction domain